MCWCDCYFSLQMKWHVLCHQNVKSIVVLKPLAASWLIQCWWQQCCLPVRNRLCHQGPKNPHWNLCLPAISGKLGVRLLGELLYQPSHNSGMEMQAVEWEACLYSGVALLTLQRKDLLPLCSLHSGSSQLCGCTTWQCHLHYSFNLLNWWPWSLIQKIDSILCKSLF